MNHLVSLHLKDVTQWTEHHSHEALITSFTILSSFSPIRTDVSNLVADNTPRIDKPFTCSCGSREHTDQVSPTTWTVYTRMKIIANGHKKPIYPNGLTQSSKTRTESPAKKDKRLQSCLCVCSLESRKPHLSTIHRQVLRSSKTSIVQGSKGQTGAQNTGLAQNRAQSLAYHSRHT